MVEGVKPPERAVVSGLVSLFEPPLNLTPDRLFFMEMSGGFSLYERERKTNGEYSVKLGSIYRLEVPGLRSIRAKVMTPKPGDIQEIPFGDIGLIPLSQKRMKLVLGKAANPLSQYPDDHSELNISVHDNAVTLSTYNRTMTQKESLNRPIVVGRTPGLFDSNTYEERDGFILAEELSDRGVSRVHFAAFLVGKLNGLDEPYLAIEPISAQGTFVKGMMRLVK